MTLDHASLIHAVEALEVVLRAGRLPDLQELIAADWRYEHRQHLQRSIGQSVALAAELRRLLKINVEDAERAVEAHLAPSYSEVALKTLLDFADEINQQAHASIEMPPAPSRAPLRRKARVA